MKKNPQSYEAHYYLGYVYYEQKKYDKMNDAFNKSLSINKEYEEDINALKSQGWVNSHNEGVNYFNRGRTTTNPDSAKFYYDQAAKYFEQAISLEPDSAESYRTLSFVHLSNNNYDAAISPLEQLLKLQKSADAYNLLGEVLYGKGVELREKYESSNNPDDSLKAMEYFNKNIELLEEARKHFPDNKDILLTLSNSYIAADKIDVAINAIKAGVEQEPENQYYRYNYGVLLLGNKEYAAAAEQFQKAIDIDPEYENAIYNLAVTYVRWGSGIADEEEARGESTDAPKEKYRMALPHLEKIVQIRKDDPAVWELLGRVYAILGYQDDAKNAFDKADSLR